MASQGANRHEPFAAIRRICTAQNDVAPPRVCIIMLTWKSYQITRDCLLSLRRLDYQNFEIILVDNGSDDGSPDQLADQFPEVNLIRNAQNLGFPGGNNVGIRMALERGADYLLLLNNDTVVAPDLLSQLVRVAEIDSGIGIVNPKIFFYEPADRLWCAGGIYRQYCGSAVMRGVHQQDRGKYDRVEEISFATGCAFLIKTEVVRRIGLLDEVFFLGYEDLDWCVRASHAGFRLYYAPSAVVWHKDSYDTKKNLGKPIKDFYSTRNKILFARKHLESYQYPFFLLSLTRWVLYRSAAYLFRAELARIRQLFRGISSGLVTPLAGENSAGVHASGRSGFPLGPS
jgi:GT2 family glycosyltransferase